MEIKVLKCNTKLTKSIVNQMKQSNVKTFTNSKILGYLVNISQIDYEVFLIEHEGNFFVFPKSFKRGNNKIYRSYKNWYFSIDIKNNDLEKKFWEKYSYEKENAKQIFI